MMLKSQDSKHPNIMSLNQGQIGHIDTYALVTWSTLDPE